LRRSWPWSRRRQEVEITAGVGVNIDQGVPVAKKSAEPAPAPAVAESDLAPPPPLLDSTSTRRNTVIPPKRSARDVIPDVPRNKPSSSGATPVNRLAGTQGQTIAARARLTPVIAPPHTKSHPEAAAVHERLDQLQRMILELGRERRSQSLHDVPTELFPLFTALIDADVEDDLACELVAKAKQHATATQLRQPQAMWSLLAGLVERELKIAGPIKPTRGRRKVVALVGPTGVGKTTTLAKLAANFRLRDGVKLGLITVDTYRIAAVEQLKTYAELIELPMKVVTTPDEMRRALDDFAGLDLVLIDTAGRSPQDEPKIHELHQILQAAQADEVHLVLSLTSSLKTLTNIAANFRPVGVTSLILTKLDEAPGLGALYSLARQVAAPISYLTTGQDVPDDIEPAVAVRLARLVLGQDQLSSREPTPLAFSGRATRSV
jgi:flagellar biosynthesis protein FlhF